ncbi:hypothetical protein M8C21_017301 [Ambrosia artemisiifolia]|uniref:SGTA homodimerisation domain-containing protein n=1 Tax=Ambrosia artemisiifolia TaxID=4212 RepID=A0AAD5CM20_AMBAR|nr:hypothetical protein M8C21_017301 [Ambrosia artemisiifolia]
MANLKADSPLCRRIVLSFLDFLDSVEPGSVSDVESLEVAKDCLSEAFKIDSASTTSVPKSDSLVQIFSSQTGQNSEIKADQIREESRASSTSNAPGVNEDELFGQFFGALEKVHYFGTTGNGDDEQALDRATHLFHNALMEMKKSGCEDIDLKKLADTFKLQGNKAMQSKVYSDAIELYTIAIALCNDNAVYYCNRDAIDKGFRKALQLDPNSESIRGNIQAAEQKLREQHRRAERGRSSGSWSYSNGGSRSHGPVPPFPGFMSDMTGSIDLSSMMADISSGMYEGNVGPGVTRINPGDELPEEINEALRSAMQMFQERDGTPDNNSNGN